LIIFIKITIVGKAIYKYLINSSNPIKILDVGLEEDPERP